MNPYRFFQSSAMMPNNLMGRVYPLENNIGLFTKLKNSFGSIKWNKFFNGANQTINFVNQAIPLIQKTRPMIDNIRALSKISRELNNNQISNKLPDTGNSVIDTNQISKKKEVLDNKPSFFI